MEVLELYLIAEHPVELSLIISMFMVDLRRPIQKKMFSIADWTWEKQVELKNQKDIDNALLNNEIVVVNFELPGLDNVGMYIERESGVYVYSFWCNKPKSFPRIATQTNIVHWLRSALRIDYICHEVLYHQMKYIVFAIGLESSIHYNKSINNMIRDARGIFFWLLNEQISNCTSSHLSEVKSLSVPHAYAYFTRGDKNAKI